MAMDCQKLTCDLHGSIPHVSYWTALIASQAADRNKLLGQGKLQAVLDFSVLPVSSVDATIVSSPEARTPLSIAAFIFSNTES